MRKLIIERHKDADKIETTQVGDTDFILVGWKCDPIAVMKVVHGLAGIEFNQIIFETLLPENQDTCNNAYVLTRVR
ncbi:hypothetical protein EAMBIBNC_00127 [Citrobacter phage BSwM KMM4]|nr:hypothetical protein [Escherichia coli]EFV7170050.1 hypothetical protein [Shigella flexneri]EGE3641523.1 hypothetical protein [Shigella flexneri]EJM9729079.1 hypothetical protein [Shigella flexneri]WBF81035.1 hypothetical protein EAMBIBNC_00127 [Citrobacter phage BSwM KMM4]